MKSKDILADSYGRVIRYLRISLTELCNFRCVYCTPAEGMPLTPSSQYLTRQEITRFVKVAGLLGIGRIRLTGGEPLLRKDILDIIRALKEIPTVEDLSITTNGSRLSQHLRGLQEAGLDRVNISLDSLDPQRFKEITLADEYRIVLQAVTEALIMGFPVKLNTVVLAGLTRAEILDFVGMARDYPLDVRFLEFMPLCGKEWRPELVMPIAKVRAIVMEHFDLRECPRGDDAAQTFTVEGGRGRVGFVASLTESFCDRCSRMRLSADGMLRPCLFSDVEVPIKKLLRENVPDGEIMEALRLAARIKPKGNWFRDKPFTGGNAGGVYEQALATPAIRRIGG